MVVLGLNLGHDGTACVVVDGRLKAALSRERVSRQKKESGVDLPLIRRVLELAGVELADVRFVSCSGYGAGHAFELFDSRTRKAFKDDLWNLDAGVYHREYDCRIDGRFLPAVFVQHQLSHCASAYYTSPFDGAACLSMDASQNPPTACSLVASGDGLDLRPLYCPGLMIGNAYYHFTEQLGIGAGLFKAGSTMGLAAYGKTTRHPRHEEFLRDFYSRPFNTDDDFIQWMWGELTGLAPHVKMGEINQTTMDVAAGLQVIFEDVALAAAQKLRADGAAAPRQPLLERRIVSQLQRQLAAEARSRISKPAPVPRLRRRRHRRRQRAVRRAPAIARAARALLHQRAGVSRRRRLARVARSQGPGRSTWTGSSTHWRAAK